MPVPVQLAVGIAFGIVGFLIPAVLGVLRYPTTLTFWGVVFGTIWICAFVAFRKRWYSFLCGFILTEFALWGICMFLFPSVVS